MIKVYLDRYSPITNFLLGVLLGGGDFLFWTSKLLEGTKNENDTNLRSDRRSN